jgi:hypothetical protein
MLSKVELWNTVQEWSYERRILSVCEKIPRKQDNHLMISVSSNMELSLECAFVLLPGDQMGLSLLHLIHYNCILLLVYMSLRGKKKTCFATCGLSLSLYTLLKRIYLILRV